MQALPASGRAHVKHSQGCKGGRVRQSYRRARTPRRYCSNCGRLQGERPTVLHSQGAQTGRYDASQPNESNRPKSLISRALDRLRLS